MVAFKEIVNNIVPVMSSILSVIGIITFLVGIIFGVYIFKICER